MREIKFRGYLKTEKKMLPVCDLNFNGVDQYAVGLSTCGRLDCGLCEDYYESIDVEVMQYTGLKDKNGVEIYEGDVLSYCIEEYPGGHYRERQETRVVAFSDGCYWLISDKGDDALFFVHEVDCEIEIIGNIHDNPELLGVAE
ncbi:hypothetical protein NCCP2716_23350 [Sporosarcina sp. NCCP-2716]|uniref:YopX family protein n=1 Tax=Sporosarcina sp. NCCP-2716 TaxID=2943679 RepID=UPI00203EF623|nr:YopX family protein [Sporosarcina sp. NCCP-2716]GKV69837.1 hypothetical protein NCCP2716_23350 [Sporosarcina sp. NCCP-2716]